MKHQTGTLIECEPAIKSIIMHINAQQNNAIVIEDLDDTHVIIADVMLFELKRLLDEVRFLPPIPSATCVVANNPQQRLKDTLKVEAPLDDSD